MFSFHDFSKNVIDLFTNLNLSKKYQKKTTTHGNSDNLFVTVLITDPSGIYLQNSQNYPLNQSIRLPLVDVINYRYTEKPILKAWNERYCTTPLKMEQPATSNEEAENVSENQQEEVSINLEQELLPTDSIMVINDLTNDSKLSCTSTKITVQTMNDDLDVSSSSWVNVCRICHGSESTEALISPCRCKGSVALTHLSCLQRWLRESSSSNCELCNHHFTIIRKPKYGFLRSIIVWLTRPEIHGPELIEDLVSFSLYTPSAIFATYILMLLCDHAVKLQNELKSSTAHMIAFFSIAGMAAIDFTYSSWIMMALQKHISAWQVWNKTNSHLTIVLPSSNGIPAKAGCSKHSEELFKHKIIEQAEDQLESITTIQEIESTHDLPNTIQSEQIEIQSLNQ